MNEALALPQGLGTINVGEVLAFPRPRPMPESTVKQLTASAGDLMRSIASILEDLILSALEKRTASDFIAARQTTFPKYFDAIIAFSKLATIAIPSHTIERIAFESFSEMEAEIREHGLTFFGAAVRDQALFAVWTLRKISDTCQRINAAPEPADKKSDCEFCSRFAWTVVMARFHLDCLLKSMEVGRPIYPDVLDVMVDGLRSAVDAFTWVRRGLDLRVPRTEPLIESPEWDDEDEALMREASNESIAEL